MTTCSGKGFKAQKDTMAESMETLMTLLVEDRQKREEQMAQEKAMIQQQMAQEKAMLQEQILALEQLVQQSAHPQEEATGGLSAPPTSRAAIPEHDVMVAKLTEKDDIEAYLVTFVRMMTAYRVDQGLWSLKLPLQLTGKAQQAYAAMG